MEDTKPIKELRLHYTQNPIKLHLFFPAIVEYTKIVCFNKKLLHPLYNPNLFYTYKCNGCTC